MKLVFYLALAFCFQYHQITYEFEHRISVKRFTFAFIRVLIKCKMLIRFIESDIFNDQYYNRLKGAASAS